MNETCFKPQGSTKRIKIYTNSKLLHNFQDKVQEIAPNFEQINQELLNQFDAFLQEADFEVIEIHEVSVVEVFEKYFSGIPPFGEGKKKHEFPDTFALLALQKEAKDRKKKIHIVTEDSDWEKFCLSSENLHWIKKLDELLETMIIGETDSNEIDTLFELYKDKEDEIKKYIEDEFSGLSFSIDLRRNSLVNWDGEPIEVKVNSVDIIDSSLIDIDDSNANELLVVFELEAEINYDANVRYESLEFAIYDKEDDMYYGGEIIEQVFPQFIKLNVEVTLILSRDENSSLCNADAGIEDITINLNNAFGEIFIDIEFEDDY